MFESRASLLPERLEALWPLMSQAARQSPLWLCHRLVWPLFADHPDRCRDFLFQIMQARPLTVILRSARRPEDRLGLWTIPPPCDFAPQLAAEQMLRFRLHAVATRTQPLPGARRGKRQDVAISAWKSLPPAEQAGRKPVEFAEEAGLDWLGRQGARHGFAFARDEVRVLGYDRHRVIADGGRMLIFGSLEFAGTLRVVDPVPFLAALGAGFGAARGFGFGLMQIAPAAARPDL